MSVYSNLLLKKQIGNTQFTCIPKINVNRKTTFRYKVIRGKSLTSSSSSSSFELFVVYFMQEDLYIGHTALALTLDLQVFS